MENRQNQALKHLKRISFYWKSCFFCEIGGKYSIKRARDIYFTLFWLGLCFHSCVILFDDTKNVLPGLVIKFGGGRCGFRGIKEELNRFVGYNKKKKSKLLLVFASSTA